MKQIGLAFIQYMSDFDNKTIPNHGCPTDWPVWGTNPAPYEFEILDPYVKNKQVFRCPSDSAVPKNVCTTNGDPPYNCSYAFNVWLNRTAEAVVVSVSTTVVGTDGDNNYYYRRNDNTGWAAPLRHNDGFNVTYFDGHVKWRRENNTDGGYHWSNGYPTPNEAGF